MIRILIADDHAIVRSGLRQILEEYKDMKIVVCLFVPPESLAEAAAWS